MLDFYEGEFFKRNSLSVSKLAEEKDHPLL